MICVHVAISTTGDDPDDGMEGLLAPTQSDWTLPQTSTSIRIHILLSCPIPDSEKDHAIDKYRYSTKYCTGLRT